MHFIGVDLAWGERNLTGVAVFDRDGRLLVLRSVTTDDEILAAIEPFAGSDCLVAFDAPLIVTNPTGNRAAEAALNRDFAKFEAGAHPVNTGKPEFSDSPRAARIAARLRLDITPRSRRRKRAIEVYPHAASIALFELGRTLKYKQKPGRDLELMRGELLLLMKLIEGLPGLALGEPWRELRALAQSAERKRQLRVAEDQVDAVLCAYIALFATREPGLITTYGDGDTGYIITPTLPAGLTPAAKAPQTLAPQPTSPQPTSPQPTSLQSTSLQSAVQAYIDELPEVTVAGDQFIDLVTGILDDAGIGYLSVSGRIKTPASFAGKAQREAKGVALYPDPIRDIRDKIGIRVITYVLSDVAAVAQLLHDQMTVLDDKDMGRETASQGRFGYASRHLLVEAPAEAGLARYQASLQIRTVLQHAWAEFEHDIRYKGTVPDEHVSEFDRRFTLAAGLLELADREFTAIRDRLRASPADQPEAQDDDPRIDPRELAAFLAGQYPDAGWSRTDHYAWISGLLLELGITSFGELSDVLRPVNEQDLGARMDYRYPPGAVRRLDDALLASYGERYLALHGNAHRVPMLRARLERLGA